MICPNCGTHIADDALICPACHFDLGMTTKIPKLEGRWCPRCGALVPQGAAACPSCGTPLEPLEPRVPAHVVTEMLERKEEEREEAISAEETRAMPRIESAVPAGPDPYEEAGEHEHMPRMREVLLVAFMALLIVGGTVLMITHPWDPEAYSIKAKKPADTSEAGYPGSLESLKGQDTGANAVSGDDVVSGDQISYEQLSQIYEELGTIEGKLSQSEKSLRSTGLQGTAEQRAAAQKAQGKTSVELSNLIAKIGTVDVTSGTYEGAAKNLSTLGSWLRNWSDALGEGWERSAAAGDPAGEADHILEPLTQAADPNTGRNAYQVYFDQNYEGWAPQAPTEKGEQADSQARLPNM